MSLRVTTVTLGCKVNQYDSAALETRLTSAGCRMVGFGPEADVYVINSCTITDRADSESRQLARRARRLNPSGRVVMTGCFAQVNPLGAAIPEVDHVVGLNRIEDLVRAIRGELAERVVAEDLRSARQVRTLGAYTFTGQTRAFLKVQEGCNLFCSFCIVPFSRGASRSVPPREVLEQLENLAARGFQEVVLTGVHLGGYGSDLSPRRELADLVEMVLEHDLVPRIRLSSVDPPEVTPRLLRLLRDGRGICPYLHIPIQAASDTTLARMRRRYDVQFLEDLLPSIRESLPDAAIGTDLIAGFPGESETQFEEGMAVLARLPLTYFHVFPFSKRAGTTAAKAGEHLSRAVVRHRAGLLRRLGQAKQAAFARSLVGQELRVLVEQGRTADGDHVGYARNYQRVIFAGPVEANREVKVQIAEARGPVVWGRISELDAGGGHAG